MALSKKYNCNHCEDTGLYDAWLSQGTLFSKAAKPEPPPKSSEGRIHVDELWPRLVDAGVGVPVLYGARYLVVEKGVDGGQPFPIRFDEDSLPDWRDYASAVPDLTDAATLGCLLAEVRRLSGDPLAYLRPEEEEEPIVWGVRWRGYPVCGKSGPTEGEALLAALAVLTRVKS